MSEAASVPRVPCLAVVQARMSSTRLPGKVLADVGGEPLLGLLLQRLRRSESLDDVVIATSVESSDAPLEHFGHEHGVHVHRGPLEDVLGRFVEAIGAFDGIVVRITADCPLIDPRIVDAVVAALRDAPAAAYASNVEPRTFPDGLDVEAVRSQTLRDIASEVSLPDLREHVTLHLRRHPDRWKQTSVVHQPDLGALRWTVDTAADLAFVRAVVERLGADRYAAGLDDVLSAIRRDPPLSAEGLRG